MPQREIFEAQKAILRNSGYIEEIFEYVQGRRRKKGERQRDKGLRLYRQAVARYKQTATGGKRGVLHEKQRYVKPLGHKQVDRIENFVVGVIYLGHYIEKAAEQATA